MRIELGDEARDTVTGFKGIAIVRSEYISGCARIGLQPPMDKEGKLPDALHFDEPMLEVTKAKRIPAQPTRLGGPQPAPPQHRAPVR